MCGVDKMSWKIKSLATSVWFNLHFVLTARIEEMKHGLLNRISVLGKELPLNTLDELIDKFGGPDKVSEVQFQFTEQPSGKVGVLRQH